MLLVIGGHSRKIGKSSVVAALIGALPEARWTAVKITTHYHGPADAETPFTLVEETAPGPGDSGRYLQAGAVRSFWLRASPAGLEQAAPVLRRILDEADNVIIESNTVLRFFTPDLFLLVVDPTVEDWKESAAGLVDQADALVVVDRGTDTLASGRASGKSAFVVRPREWISAELTAFVRERLRSSAGRSE